MTFRIEEVEPGGNTALLNGLVTCWRASVEATHVFLAPSDVERIAAYVPDAIASVAHLAVCRDENNQIVGFIGIDGAMIEMLFIQPSRRGQGLGTHLLDHATSEHGATLVDVNEQKGFIGIDGAMIEMLFIQPSRRGQGLGTHLLDHATSEHGATLVDVNEQNEQAVGFYEHYGFQVFGRSETDAMGDPFPILHMRLPRQHEIATD